MSTAKAYTLLVRFYLNIYSKRGNLQINHWIELL